jgi:excinuclease ABC subunit A
MARRYRETDSVVVREDLARYRSTQPCQECGGTRLRREARHVKIGEGAQARGHLRGQPQLRCAKARPISRA